jgi:hypothetical protein
MTDGRVHRRERRRPGGAAQKATAEEKDVAEITKRTQSESRIIMTILVDKVASGSYLK